MRTEDSNRPKKAAVEDLFRSVCHPQAIENPHVGCSDLYGDRKGYESCVGSRNDRGISEELRQHTCTFIPPDVGQSLPATKSPMRGLTKVMNRPLRLYSLLQKAKEEND